MEVEINIGDMAAKITVKDTAEAASFLSDYADKREAAARRPVVAASSENARTKPLTDPAPTDATLLSAIERLRGTTTAKVLACLAKEPSGMSDSQIRSTIGQPDLNLGPVFANVTKTCKRSGTDVSAVYSKKQSRDGRNNVYHYRLTQRAIHIIESIPDFQ